MAGCVQDEMAALQRLNTSFFLTGYLGFTAVWVMDLISRIMAKQAVAHAAGRIKAVLRLASPHYCFAQGLYDITNTYKDAGQSVHGGERTQLRMQPSGACTACM